MFMPSFVFSLCYKELTNMYDIIELSK